MRLEAECWRLEAGGWRLSAGGWRLSAGGWRLEAGGWRLEAQCCVFIRCVPPPRQKAAPARGQGEVLPTLDMALFDWTDYEDMKPVDSWPPSRKKGTRPPGRL